MPAEHGFKYGPRLGIYFKLIFNSLTAEKAITNTKDEIFEGKHTIRQ